jgi:pimeloyl-ACP methyl ester carboxylesterase
MRSTERVSMPFRAAVVALLVLPALVAGCDRLRRDGAPADGGPAIALEDCILSAPDRSASVDARCGTLTVYEDREAASGRRIELNVAVVPAVDRDPAPDPLFLLAGGPGQAATEVYPSVAPYLDRIHQERDIVLVDQRGTGGSNRLDCPDLERDGGSDVTESDVTQYDEADLARWAASCVDHLAPTADLRLYTTAIAMDDLDDVRAALGYGQVNLYGGSYGTRAALEYLRRHPERVRTVILDSVVPPDLALGTTVARDAQRALDLFFARCAEDEVCRATYPDLRAEFDTLMDRLDEGPMAVELAHPFSGRSVEVTLTRDKVAGALRFMSYAPESAVLLPLLIHHTVDTGDYRRLAAQFVNVSDATANMLSLGMHCSVVCAEDVPFFEDDDVAQRNADTYLADLLTDGLEKICDAWPRGEIPDGFKAPVVSDVPVLILSGEADPVTPPAYGDAVADTLPNGLHLVAPGQGHGVLIRGCVPRVAAEFVAAGTADGLDTECVERLSAPPFFVNFSGPVAEPEPTGEGGRLPKSEPEVDAGPTGEPTAEEPSDD